MKHSGTSLLVEWGEGVDNLEVIHSPCQREVNMVPDVSQSELFRVLGHFCLEIWSSQSFPEGEGVAFLEDFL